MNIRFADTALAKIYTDATFTGGWDNAIVARFRMTVKYIVDAADERDFRAMRSFNFERLKGNRDHQYSIRLNKQWRLILEFEGARSKKVVVIISIEDYH